MLSQANSRPDTQPIMRELVGPEAWKRTELRQQDWRVVLDAAAQAEVVKVIETLRQQPVPLLALRPDSFDMPACRSAMGRVSQIIKRGVRFALVERLPIDALSEDEAKSIYWMLSSMVARPVAQKLDGTMIYDVTDTGKKPLPGSGVRQEQRRSAVSQRQRLQQPDARDRRALVHPQGCRWRPELGDETLRQRTMRCGSASPKSWHGFISHSGSTASASTVPTRSLCSRPRSSSTTAAVCAPGSASIRSATAMR